MVVGRQGTSGDVGVIAKVFHQGVVKVSNARCQGVAGVGIGGLDDPFCFSKHVALALIVIDSGRILIVAPCIELFDEAPDVISCCLVQTEANFGLEGLRQ